MNKSKNSRRDFIRKSGAAIAGFYIVPRHVIGGAHFTSPSDMLNVAAVGAGGRGRGVINSFDKEQVNMVALCDVDFNRAATTFKDYPNAKQYKDFRVMLDSQNDIDAVAVSTPDHTHAVVAMEAMRRGKHVYVEKPLAHNLQEVRRMTEAARKYKVASQMGNQGASGDGTWQVVEWLEKGYIGEVHKVHCWTNRPIWPQGVPTPTGDFEIPETLDWDLWLGPARYREYNPAYLPFKWRGWWDYGTGALGDMACHIVDPAFRALKLGYPIAVEASATNVYVGDFVEANYPDSCPQSSKIVFDFPDRGPGLPALKLIWYDGGIMPDRPDELGPDEEFGKWDGGVLIEGSEGKILHDVYGNNPRLLPKSRMDEINPELKESPIKEGHYQNWVNACKDGPKAVSDFDIAGPLTETILMGNLAIRSYQTLVLKEGRKVGDWAPYDYPGRKKLMWDGENMKITNFDMANEFVSRQYRDGWELGV